MQGQNLSSKMERNLPGWPWTNETTRPFEKKQLATAGKNDDQTTTKDDARFFFLRFPERVV